MDDERADKARWKAHDGAPSQREDGNRQSESAMLGFGVKFTKVYEALEEMLSKRKD